MNAQKILIAVALVSLVLMVVLMAFSFGSSRSLPERRGQPSEGRVEKSDADWKAMLSAEQFQVTRKHGTERAFSGVFWNHHEDGVYRCVCCGQELFDSKTKFDSGTGWPSYWQPVDESNISLLSDRSLFTTRTEVICSRCDAHLGHVFPDGPEPTGQRYCINSAALQFSARK